MTWFWRCSWVKLYFSVYSQAAPSYPVAFCHRNYLLLLSRNQELGGYICPFPVRLLWVAQGSSGFSQPLNYLQLYLVKTPGLKWGIFVVWISIRVYLEGSKESLGCVNFCYSCNLCRDVTPSQVLWDHFWKTLFSHLLYKSFFCIRSEHKCHEKGDLLVK